MGTYMDQGETKFNIKAKNTQRVVKAIKALHGQESIYDSSGSHFSWVDNKFYKLNTLQELMTAFRWEPTIDENGNIINVTFKGQKWGDDEQFFEAIAPYVETGSYIIMDIEGELHKWAFNDGKFLSLVPEESQGEKHE